MPGHLNVVADGLSRQWDNMEWAPTHNNGSEWSVSLDPESCIGLVNDVFTTEKITGDLQQLHSHFTNKPLYLEVIDAILNIDTTPPNLTSQS